MNKSIHIQMHISLSAYELLTSYLDAYKHLSMQEYCKSRQQHSRIQSYTKQSPSAWRPMGLSNYVFSRLMTLLVVPRTGLI